MYLHKLYLLIVIYVSYISRIHCQEASSCFEELTVNTEAATLSSFTEVSADVSSLVVGVFEATEVGDIIYNISWKDSNNPYVDNAINDNTALDYANIVIYETLLSVEITNSLIGIVDYNNPDRQENLFLTLYFEFPNLQKICTINIRHEILDNNTEVPNFSVEEYSISLREDYPTFMEIPDFAPMIYDFDADYPNNFFTVEMSEGCPLAPAFNQLECFEGNPVTIDFGLIEPLDYDTMQDPFQLTCTVTLTDAGVPQLMSNSTIITITVTPFPDENPVFSSDFYQGTLADPLAGSKVSVDPPIEAVDPDMPPSDYIIYSMVSADNTVGGDEYFSINDTTAEVTVIQDIDNDFLSWEIVYFILNAYDSDDQCSKGYLSINLPPQSSSDSDSGHIKKDSYSSKRSSSMFNKNKHFFKC